MRPDVVKQYLSRWQLTKLLRWLCRANEGVLAEDTWTESEIEDAEAAEQATMVLYRSSGMLGSCEVSHNATD
jgi:hypothetical protein